MALLATATASHGALPSPVTVLLVLGGVGYVMWTRLQGQPLKQKKLIVLPALYIVLGIGDLSGAHVHRSGADIAFLIIGFGVSALLGAARGATIELMVRGGELWQRYRPVTVTLWVGLVVSKVILAAIASLAGASGGAGTNGLLLSLGISLVAEGAIVAPRALASGVAFASPDTDKDPRTAPDTAPENWHSPTVAEGIAWLRRQLADAPGSR